MSPACAELSSQPAGVDGYVAGTDITLDNPTGDGAEPLFEWIHNLASWRQRHRRRG
ncbi:hypothetical protein ACWD0J_32360 [Streptomyces sp. NPDC003011]